MATLAELQQRVERLWRFGVCLGGGGDAYGDAGGRVWVVTGAVLCWWTEHSGGGGGKILPQPLKWHVPNDANHVNSQPLQESQ